jgi:hypothetical protein
MINERLKRRLKKDRPSTTITMRIPADVVESLKTVAPLRGFTAYQTLLKSYISEGLRRDEVQFDQYTARKLTDALKRRGVEERVLEEALAEVARAS